MVAFDLDRDATLPDTLLQCRKGLEIIRHGINRALQVEEHYWLVYNATQLVMDVAKRACNAGQPGEALPLLVYSAVALESNIRLSLPRFLPWRCEVYAAAVQCYRAAEGSEEALKFLDHGLDVLKDLEELQKLDPLPCPREVLDAYAAAKLSLRTLRFSLTASSIKTDTDVAVELAKFCSTDVEQIRALIGALQVRTDPAISC